MVKTARQVPSALRVWKSEKDLRPVIRALLFSIDSQTETVSLATLRREHENVIRSLGAAEEGKRLCREFFEDADRAASMNLPKERKIVVQKTRSKRAKALAAATLKCERLNEERKRIESNLNIAEARFAQVQVLELCQGERYKMNPLKIANALAGLPRIGCRRSSLRCAPWQCPNSGGHLYGLFQEISRIVDSWNWDTDLKARAQRWLKAKRRLVSRATLTLRDDWYYLGPSIEIAMKRRCSREELPFRITREYLRRKRSRTPEDRLLEVGDRIVVC